MVDKPIKGAYIDKVYHSDIVMRNLQLVNFTKMHNNVKFNKLYGLMTSFYCSSLVFFISKTV